MSQQLTKDDLDLLRKVHLFDCVGLESVEGYLETCLIRELHKDDILLSPGQENDKVYLLLTGRLRVHLSSPDHPPHFILEAGECVGEMSIINETETSAYVIAEEDCRIMVVNQDTLWAFINTSHGVSRNLLYILSQRIRFGNEIIIHQEQVQHQLQHYASIDGLTGLHNRHWMNQIFERQLKRSSMNGEALSMIMLDADDFKGFNDKYGHLAGDRALCSLAVKILEHLRPNDLAVRYGGEEFVILLPQTTVEEARVAAQRLCKTARNMMIHLPNGRALPGVTISLGIAQMSPGDSLEMLIAAADAALYRAKEKGRDCVSG